MTKNTLKQHKFAAVLSLATCVVLAAVAPAATRGIRDAGVRAGAQGPEAIVQAEARLRASAIACTSPRFSASVVEDSKQVIARASKPGDAAPIEQAVEALVPTLAAGQPARNSRECEQFVRLIGGVTLFQQPQPRTVAMPAK